MKRNVGTVDRTIRIIAGIAIIAWGISTKNQWGFLGLIPLITGLTRWCPAYCPIGMNTDKPGCCGKKETP